MIGYLLSGAVGFNQDLNWDVSAVQAVEGIFFNASSFNGDLSSWRLSPDVTDLGGMFQGNYLFRSREPVHHCKFNS